MRTKEQLEKDKLVSKNLNKTMREAFTMSKESPNELIYVYRQGTEFKAGLAGEMSAYVDIARFHACIKNGVIVEEG